LRARPVLKESGRSFKKKPKNLYELVHGPSYIVEAINVDEVMQMNGSLVRRSRNLKSSTLECRVREERVNLLRS
jgi:hypothetical protein